MRRRPSTAAEVPAVIWVQKRKRRNRRGKRRSRIPGAPSPTRHPIPRRSESSRPQNATPSGSRFPQEPPRNPAVPPQKTQDTPRTTGLLPTCPGPPRSIDEAARHGDQFWHRQPAPTLSDPVTCRGAIKVDRDSVCQGPSLPQGLTDPLDLGDADMLRALYRLLGGKHTVAEDCLFRSDCSPQFLLSVKRVVDSSFLCAPQERPGRRVAPVWIRGITRRGKPQGILQAVYTARVVLLKPVVTHRGWHPPLNPRKLAEVRFSRLSRNTTLQRAMEPCGRPAKESDVFSALDLMENETFLEKLKFGIGDSSLQYDLYNWGWPGTEWEKVGFVLQSSAPPGALALSPPTATPGLPRAEAQLAWNPRGQESPRKTSPRPPEPCLPSAFSTLGASVGGRQGSKHTLRSSLPSRGPPSWS